MQEGGNTNFNGQPNFSQPQNQQFPSQTPAISQPPIYLDNAAKKSKKLIGILVIVIILFIVGLCIFLIAIKSNNNDEVMAAFCRYSNYLLYGEENLDSCKNNLVINEQSYYDNMLNLAEHSDFTDKLELYYSTYYNEISKNDLLKDENIKQAVNFYNSEYQLSIKIDKFPIMNFSDIVTFYITNDEMATKNHLEEIANKYQNIEEIYDISYFKLLRTWSEENLNLLKKYNSMGCINKSGIDYDCSSRLHDNELENIQNKLSNTISNIKNLAKIVKHDIVKNPQYLLENLKKEDNDEK